MPRCSRDGGCQSMPDSLNTTELGNTPRRNEEGEKQGGDT